MTSNSIMDLSKYPWERWPKSEPCSQCIKADKEVWFTHIAIHTTTGVMLPMVFLCDKCHAKLTEGT